MLNEDSYQLAIYIYLAAGILILPCLAWSMRRRWSAGWICLAVLLSAALLLTPAFPRTDVSTMAPALVVAGFAFFTDGYEAAEHALRPLAVMCLLAVGIALILRLTVLRNRGARPAAKTQAPVKP